MNKIIVVFLVLCFLSFDLKAHENDDFLRDYLENINQNKLSNSKIGFYQIKKMVNDKKAVLVDVRYEDEEAFKIKDVDLIRMPISKVPEHLTEIPKEKIVITVCGGRCTNGELASIARLYFKSKGYEAFVYPFGIENLKSEFEK